MRTSWLVLCLVVVLGSGPATAAAEERAPDESNARLTEIQRQVRVLPHFEDGKLVGFRLMAVRRDLVFGRAGFKSGDVVVAINGKPLTRPLDLWKAVEEPEGGGRARAEVLRDGRPTTLEYAVPPPAAPPPPKTAPAESRYAYKGGIRQESETVFTVDRAEIDRAMENLPLLSTGIRGVPHFDHGKLNGIRLFAIRRDTVFERLGLKNGDILKSINGRDTLEPAGLADIVREEKDEGRIAVELERDRQPAVLTYEIR